MAKRKSRATEPVKAWATISDDVPPYIWEVSWYEDMLERQDLRHIEVMVVPLSQYRRLLKQRKAK